jgi:hypothetical protein
VQQISLTVFIYQEGPVWCAYALEHDIAAFSRDPEKLCERFTATVDAELILNKKRGRSGLDGIPPFPRPAYLYGRRDAKRVGYGVAIGEWIVY